MALGKYNNRYDINHSIGTKHCVCRNCKQKATIYVTIVSKPQSGYYCDQCATGLKWHGIGEVCSDFDLLHHYSDKLATIQEQEDLESH